MKKQMKSAWKKRSERIDHGLKFYYPGFTNVNGNAKSEGESSKSHYQLCDLLFLFSQPLVERDKDKKLKASTNQILEIDKEYRVIKRMIEEHRIDFLMNKKPGTVSTLLDAFQQQPKIVHISCHGQDSEKEGVNLRIEDEHTIALEKVFTEEDIKNILGHLLRKSGIPQPASNGGIQMLFINACHSERVGKYFQEHLQVPVVIAVDSKYPINDSASIEFSRQFYSYLILGYSPLNAHLMARNQVFADPKINHNLCFNHKHTSWCKHTKDSKLNKEFQAQQQAIFIELTTPPVCKCYDNSQHQQDCPISKDIKCECPERFNNSHQADCKFYLRFAQFVEEVQKKQINVENVKLKRAKEPLIQMPNWSHKHLCCCQPGTLEHSQANRFVIMGNIEDLEKPLFIETYSGTVYDNQSFTFRKNQVKEPRNPSNLIMRNELVQEIAQIFKTHPVSGVNKILYFYGPKGVGKEDLIQQGVNIAFHRDHLRYAQMYQFDKGSLENCMKAMFYDLNKALNLKISSKLTASAIVKAINMQAHFKGLFNIVLVLNKPMRVLTNKHAIDQFKDFLTQFRTDVDKEIGVKLAIIEDVGEGENQRMFTEGILNEWKAEKKEVSDSIASEEQFVKFAYAFLQPTGSSTGLNNFFQLIFRKCFEKGISNRRQVFSRYLENLKSFLLNDTINVENIDTQAKKCVVITEKLNQIMAEQSSDGVIEKIYDQTFHDNKPIDLNMSISHSQFEDFSNISPSKNREFSSHLGISEQPSVCHKCREQITAQPVTEKSEESDDDTNHSLGSKKSMNDQENLHYLIQKRGDFFRQEEGIIQKFSTLNNPILYDRMGENRTWAKPLWCLRHLTKSKILNGFNLNQHQLPINANVTFKSTFKFDQGFYQGQVKYKTKTPHGYGMFINQANGSIYEGFRVNGVREGPGYYVEAISESSHALEECYIKGHLLIYEGNWQNNQPQDQGTMYFPNGDIYNGNFADGKLKGKGSLYINSEKRLYIGYFKNGLRSGGKFKVITNVFMSTDHKHLAIQGDSLLQEYYSDKLSTEEQNIQAINFILIPPKTVEYPLIQQTDSELDIKFEGQLVACESLRQYYSQENLSRICTAFFESEETIEQSTSLVEYDASKLVSIIQNHAPGISNIDQSTYISLLQISSLSYGQNLKYPCRAVLGLSKLASPFLTHLKNRVLGTSGKVLLDLVQQLRPSFFELKNIARSSHPQITAPLKMQDNGARIGIDVKSIEYNVQKFQKTIEFLLTQQVDPKSDGNSSVGKFQHLDESMEGESDVLTFTRDQMRGLIHSEFASVSILFKTLTSSKSSSQGVKQDPFLKLKVAQKSQLFERRMRLGKFLLASLKAHQTFEALLYTPLDEISGLPDFASMKLESPLQESLLSSHISLSKIAPFVQGQGKVYTREKSEGELLKEKIKNVQESICGLILNKESSKIGVDDLYQKLSDRDALFAIIRNTETFKFLNSGLEQEQSATLAKAIEIFDHLQELDGYELQLSDLQASQAPQDINDLCYLVGTFAQHLGLDQTSTLLSKLGFYYFKKPENAQLEFSVDDLENFAKQYDSRQLNLIENNLGYNFENDKVWLAIALSQDPDTRGQQAMNELGRALVNLSVAAFCDRTYPDNSVNQKVQRVLEETFAKENTLKFIGSKMKLDNFLVYTNSKEFSSLKNFLNLISGNPSEAVKDIELIEKNRGYGDRLQQLRNSSQSFLGLKMEPVGSKSPTLSIIAALALEAPSNARLERMHAEISQLIPFILALSSTQIDQSAEESNALLRYTSLQAIRSRSTAGTLQLRRVLGLDSALPQNNHDVATFTRTKFNSIMLKFYGELEFSAEQQVIADMAPPKNILINAKTLSDQEIERNTEQVQRLLADQLINVKVAVTIDNNAAKTKYIHHLMHSKIIKYINYIQQEPRFQGRSLLQELIYRANHDYHHFVLSKISMSKQKFKQVDPLLAESSDDNEHDPNKLVLAQKIDLLKTMRLKNEQLLLSAIEQPGMLPKRYNEVLSLAKNESDAINYIRQLNIVGDSDTSNSTGISDMRSGASWISYKVGDMKIKQPLPEKLVENEYLQGLANIERKIKEQVYEQQLYQLFHIMDFPGKPLKDWIEIIVLKDNQCVISDYLMLRMDLPLFKNLIKSFKPTLSPEQAKINVHQITRIMLQTVFYIADMNQNKGFFHGNNKEERIYMSPCGVKGFIDQGSYVALYNNEEQHEVIVPNTTNAKLEFKRKFKDKKSVFFTKEELLEEDWYELMMVCNQPMRVVTDGIKKAPHLIQIFKDAGGDIIEETVRTEQHQLAFLKAQMLSLNPQLCLRMINSLRETNQVYYSYHFWRYFEGCIRRELFVKANLLTIINGNFNSDFVSQLRSEEELEEIEELFMQDHWWTLVGDGNGVTAFPGMDTELSDLLHKRHPWVNDACKLKFLIINQVEEVSSLADGSEQISGHENGEEHILEAVNRLANIIAALDEEFASKIKASINNAFKYPAHFIRENIAETLRPKFTNIEQRNLHVRNAQTRFDLMSSVVHNKFK